MIVVVADDITGAAELAGIGIMHGLSVELDIEGARPSSADMMVIATNTRSKDLEEALEEIRDLSFKIAEQKPEWIYKKIDSVLRGYVLEETKAMVDSLKIGGAIIVPANPALGRVIVDGIYYIDGKPLESTSFSQDPEFESSTSSVARLLSRNGSTPPFEIMKPKNFTGRGGIVVGEASSHLDLDFWAEKASSDWLPVGAAGFFQALLLIDGKPPVNGNHASGLPDNTRTLYLCGSTFQGSREQVAKENESGPHVSYMPEDLFWKREGYVESLEEWIETVVSIIENHNKVIVAVSEPVVHENGKSNWIRHNFAVLVKEVYKRTRIQELVIEGGSTASSVISTMGMTRLVPLHQFQQGVIRMKVEDIPGLNLTLKPGSYTWPKSVWKFDVTR